MKRVLITGITGFLGSSLVNYFRGHEKITIFGHSRDVEAAKGRFGDITFLTDLSSHAFNAHEIDTVIHLAGIAHDLSGRYKEKDYYRVNYEQTAALYDNFIASNAGEFVFVSSVKAVADHADGVIDEQWEPAPASPYGKSKLLAEQYLSRNPVHGKKVFILRPVMIHGPGNKGNLNLLYQFASKGFPWPLGAFENRRSFLSVENFCFVIENIIAGVLSQGDYLLADSEPLSTNTLIRLIADETGRKVKIMKIPRFFIRLLAGLGSVVRLPLNNETLGKLTDDMVVSNQKLLLNLGRTLPVEAEEGLRKTFRSFNE